MCFTKSYPNKEVNGTQPSPSVSDYWLLALNCPACRYSCLSQRTRNEGEGLVQFTSLLRWLVLQIVNNVYNIKRSQSKLVSAWRSMRLFHPVNSLVVNGNLWLILLGKIRQFSNLVKHISKNFKYVLIFSLASVVAELLAIL